MTIQHPSTDPASISLPDEPQLFQLASKYPATFHGLTVDKAQPIESPATDSFPPQEQEDQPEPQEPQKIQLTVRKSREKFFAPVEIDSLEEHAHSSAKELIEQEEINLSEEEENLAVDRLHAELFGLGPLEPLLKTPELTDIFVNSPAEVWIEASGILSKTSVTFSSEEDVRALATRLITSAGARLDDACPSADVQNERGQRIHAVLPPLSRGNTVLSIRIQPEHRASLAQLHHHKMFDRDVSELLKYLVATRRNFLVSGGTGTGKTTLLNALLSECSHHERIVTIEDAAELQPTHPHVVSLQTRGENAEGRGEISLSELIRQSLRMKPTRLVLGECRGAELADMLTAMNTGHSGTGGTLHANSVEAIPARLFAMGALAGLSTEATALQASTAVEFLVHIEKSSATRFIAEIARLTYHNGELGTESLFRLDTGRRRSLPHWSPAGLVLLEEAKNHEPEV